MSAQGVTPMMEQFLEIKKSHPDALLFYRMGDFYEMFFDDAVAAAEALDIALTKRGGKHLGEDIPMCGVPVHSAEGYLLTLIRKGFRVAVCEQMEDPAEARKRGPKAVVKREVVRLVTPGTLTEDTLLEARAHNFLCAWTEVRGEGALAWTDISTGGFWVMGCGLVRLGPELARLSPGELICADDAEERLLPLADDHRVHLTPLSRASFDSEAAKTRLTKLYDLASLDGIGAFDRSMLGAMGGIVDYLELTQKGNLPRLHRPQTVDPGGAMQIDASTRRSLELTRSMSGNRGESLLACVDRTITAAGARLLETRLSSPSTRIELIRSRLGDVDALIEAPDLARDIREELRGVPDLDRALGRLAMDRGGPRDLVAVRRALERARAVAGRLDGAAESLASRADDLAGGDSLARLLAKALIPEPPLAARDGGFVADGYDGELDEARKLRDQGRTVISELQGKYCEHAEIPALKIKHNNVLGYFVETNSTHAKKMMSEPLSDTFRHRQTTANVVRFSTAELSELESGILNAAGRAVAAELRVYAFLRDAVLDASDSLFATARALAELDVSCGWATLAAEEDWVRPEIDDSRAFVVEGGRHPVVEAALKRDNASFIANDCDLGTGDERIWLLTGPNMAGKSTYLRQNALIALLAQVGAYVPAARARIGVVSQLFSRVGASDDLARGQSTFMVEMVETASILNRADDRALVILDEIGRGTATYDGLSIAWATLEHLVEVNRCRALFATHYHELTALAERLPALGAATVSVKEWDGEVVFLHEVRRGTADRSYGVQVAKLAGLPPSVIARARDVLDMLEATEREGGRASTALIDDLPLFTATPPSAPPPARAGNDPLRERVDEIRPDDLSPREALDLIYELKGIGR